MNEGKLLVNVKEYDTQTPIQGAQIALSQTGSPEQTIEKLTTDSSGITQEVLLPAPDAQYSMAPGAVQPFSEYNIIINAPGYQEVSISGVDIFSGETAIQEVLLRPRLPVTSPEIISIPFNTLWGSYPPKIAESETVPLGEPGEIVLSRVVVPEYVIVHDGAPTDGTATDYYVPYGDYIKNVASSEIYSTWPRETLKANILAIMSFTLNRVYTEFYRNRGYDFTITSSTAFDHKWVHGRNIFESISQVVDEILTNYLSRPNIRQPILTQYCDGKSVSCPNWLSQWGSKDLGDKGYSAIQILRYYYGDSMYINSAEEISGIPASWPGSDLDIGSTGIKVRQIQEELNLIGEYYNAIQPLIPDGIYGENTAKAVAQFQKIFNLGDSGIVDYPTWYRISDMYVRLSKIAELQ
jgi:hypothetical protein